MGCTASVPVKHTSVPVKHAQAEIRAVVHPEGFTPPVAATQHETPTDVERTSRKISETAEVKECECTGPQPIDIASAPAANADVSPREGAPTPFAPMGVGCESAGTSPGTIVFHEGQDRLEWGLESFSAEELNALLDSNDSSIERKSLNECLSLVREDALQFSSVYEEMRKCEGGHEALEEVAHECAAIRQKVLEDTAGDTRANCSFDRGEGVEEEIENFWNEPFFLLVSAAKVYDRFSEWVGFIARQSDSNTTHSVSFKPIVSAAQKASRPRWNRGAPQADGAGKGRGWGSLVDIVRASVVVDDWDCMLRCLKAVRGDFDVEILRIRTRFNDTADVPQVWGGYRHIALTIRLLGHGHVCELLIHHRKLYNLRSPDSDERFRKFRHALACSQAGEGGVETFTQLLSPRPACP